MINNVTMNNFKLIQNKIPENIHRRVFAKCKSFARSILYPYNESGKYDLLNSKIKIQEGEIPLFESYTNQGYLLITTSNLYSEIKVKMKDTNYERSYFIPIEDIKYEGDIMDIIEERKQRTVYQEEIIKHINITNGESVEVVIKTGIEENIFHEVLTQLTWLCNKYRNQKSQT